MGEQKCRPHGWSQYLGESVKINDMVIVVKRLQGWNRSGLMREFTVVVIFYDVGIVSDCPLQKPQPVADRNGAAGRKLMGWHNIKKVTEGIKKLVNINAIFNNWNRKKFISVLEKNIPDTIVRWLFIGNPVLLCREQPADDFNAILGAGHKDYLFRIAVNATVPVQIMTDIGTEFIVSFIGFVLDFLLIYGL